VARSLDSLHGLWFAELGVGALAVVPSRIPLLLPPHARHLVSSLCASAATSDDPGSLLHKRTEKPGVGGGL
jgi:hypothetical protein